MAKLYLTPWQRIRWEWNKLVRRFRKPRMQVKWRGYIDYGVVNKSIPTVEGVHHLGEYPDE